MTAISTCTAANRTAVQAMFDADPVLVDVGSAGEKIPGMTPTTILTSGRPLPWREYSSGQQRAILYGAVYEGLAPDIEAAGDLLDRGKITIGACHDYGCVGSVAGIYTASMPVFVVHNAAAGNTAFCNLYEGKSRRRLNYGSYDQEVEEGLRLLERVIGPVIGAAVRGGGGIELKPIMRRALNMGDELHSRNTASSLMFSRELTQRLLGLDERQDGIDRARMLQTLAFLAENDYFFLRLSMAAAKATADAAHGVEGSSVVTAMTLSSRNFAIRVSGLGDRWYSGPMPTVKARFFDDFTEDDIEWIGGESLITETIGLGGFAQAAAFALQAYQGGSPKAMVDNNLAMYDITVGENPDYRIPYLGHRGTPTGIELFAVQRSGVLPVIDGGLAGKDGGQIGAGLLVAPKECFDAATEAFSAQYGIDAAACEAAAL
ncbi:DUF1116 domain-containing protein [Mycobacterium sp. NPDC051198]